MTEFVIDASTLPESLHRLIRSEKVRVKENDDGVQLVPVKENADCTIGLRGMFAGDPEMTVDRFHERMRAEKEMEL